MLLLDGGNSNKDKVRYETFTQDIQNAKVVELR